MINAHTKNILDITDKVVEIIDDEVVKNATLNNKEKATILFDVSVHVAGCILLNIAENSGEPIKLNEFHSELNNWMDAAHEVGEIDTNPTKLQ